MIENQMTVYHEQRMSHDSYLAMELRKMRRCPIKPAETPCIVAPTRIEGSRFHAKG